MHRILKNKGFIIIVAIGVLTLLSFIGIAFVMLARTAGKVSKAAVDGLRAEFLSATGFEYAIATLDNFARTKFVPEPPDLWVFYGEDSNRDGLLQQDEDINKDGRLNISTLSLKEIKFPSFPSLPKTITNIENELKTVSGYLFNSYPSELPTDVFLVKIIDNSSKIWINNPNMEFILNNLSNVLGIPKNLGTILKNYKESKKILNMSLSDVRKALQLSDPIEGDKLFNLLTEYITDNTWVDNKVIKPKPYYKRGPFTIYCKDSGISYKIPRPTKEGDFVRSHLALYPGKVELEPRAPVNVNLAPYEVLVSLLTNISAVYIDDSELETNNFDAYYSSAKNYYDKEIMPKIRNEAWFKKSPYKLFLQILFDNNIFSPRNLLKNYEVFKNMKPSFSVGRLKKLVLTRDKAEKVARAILERRLRRSFLGQAGFYTWEDFYEFLNDLIDNKTINTNERDLIIANFNPNTSFNDFNPDIDIYKAIDKSDLLDYTTEFVFGPTGIFDIESLGIVVNEKHEIQAEHAVKGYVKVFDMYRETSQDDFLKGVTNISQVTGNQTMISYPINKIEPAFSDFNLSSDGYLTLNTVEFKDNPAYNSIYPALIECQKLTFPDSYFFFDYYRFFQTLTELTMKGKVKINPPPSICKGEKININPNATDKAEDLKKFSIEDLNLETGKIEKGSISFWIKFPAPLRPGFHRFITLPICGFSTTFAKCNKPLRNIWNTYKQNNSVLEMLTNTFEFGFLKGYKEVDLDKIILFWETPDDLYMFTNLSEIRDSGIFTGGIWTNIILSWDNSSNLKTVANTGDYEVEPPLKVGIYLNGEPLIGNILPKKTKFKGAYNKTLNLDDYANLFQNEPLANFFMWLPNDYNFEFSLGGFYYSDDFVTNQEALKIFSQGRYYNQNDAYFISQPIKVPEKVKIGTVSWTDYKASRKAGEFSKFISLFNLQILDANKKELLSKEINDPKGTAVNLLLKDGKFHYKVSVNTNLIFEEGEEKTLVASPIFDDITITLIPAQKEIYLFVTK